jgi:hypothetical protein
LTPTAHTVPSDIMAAGEADARTGWAAARSSSLARRSVVRTSAISTRWRCGARGAISPRGAQILPPAARGAKGETGVRNERNGDAAPAARTRRRARGGPPARPRAQARNDGRSYSQWRRRRHLTLHAKREHAPSLAQPRMAAVPCLSAS